MRKEKVNSKSEGDVRKVAFEPLIKVDVAAGMLGLEPNTLYQWIERGTFEGLKIGKKAVRVRPEAVRAFLESAQREALAKVA